MFSIDVDDTPQQVQKTASRRFLPAAAGGTRCHTCSTPRDAVEEGFCEDNGGIEGVREEEDCDGRVMAGWVEMVEAVGNKVAGKMRWKKEEKVMLWECFVRTGGVRRNN